MRTVESSNLIRHPAHELLDVFNVFNVLTSCAPHPSARHALWLVRRLSGTFRFFKTPYVINQLMPSLWGAESRALRLQYNARLFPERTVDPP